MVKRNAKAITRYQNSTNDNPHLIPNTDNAITPDYTPLILSRVQYGKLLKRLHLVPLQNELTARGIVIPTSERNKIRYLIKVLKEDEGDPLTFLPRTQRSLFY